MFDDKTGEAFKKIQEAIEKAVRDTAEKIKEESQANCPVESGKLRDSCKVDVSISGDNVEAVISYNTPYAVKVHELSNKFLEQAGNSKGSNLKSNTESELNSL